MKEEVDGQCEVKEPLGSGVDVCHKLEVGKPPQTCRRICRVEQAEWRI